MNPFSRLFDSLVCIPDPRRGQGKRYSLPHLLLFSVLAILSGAKGYIGLITFMEERLDVLNEVFGSKFKRAPSVNTVRTLLQVLGAEPIETVLRRHAGELVMASDDDGMMPIVALDGKVLRGSFDHFNDRKAVHTLSAFAAGEGIVLAQVEIDDKTNEIPVVQALIRELGLAGVIYTTDALHCQIKTFEATEDTDSFLLTQVKSNQPTLASKLLNVSDTIAASDRAEFKDKIAHGRQERRVVETFDVGGRLGADWNGLIACAARVSRPTWHKDAKSGQWHYTEEIAFYVCQTRLSAKAFGHAIRSHWGIENRNHHVRDVTLGEDGSRIRIRPVSFARLRSMALNILRANGVKNVARALFRNALNPENVLTYSRA
jgi:predicted transposase YbfD/YdcC